jgi:lysophospholipase L1-like esterase
MYHGYRITCWTNGACFLMVKVLLTLAYNFYMRRILLAAIFGGLVWSQTPPPTPASAPATVPDESTRLRTQLERSQRVLKDWPNLARYHDDNASLTAPPPDTIRVVFMGDSITDNWGRRYSKFFEGKPYINRGIGGQTTPQMLIRFRPDVIALRPQVVVILAGTNDIAGNTGVMTLEAIEDNLVSMAELARVNNIRVVFSSVMPVCDYIRSQTVQRPPEKIIALNSWMKDYAARNNHVYLDYYSAMLDDKQMLRQDITDDGLHPNAAGYDIMAPLAEKAIAAALAK